MTDSTFQATVNKLRAQADAFKAKIDSPAMQAKINGMRAQADKLSTTANQLNSPLRQDADMDTVVTDTDDYINHAEDYVND